MIVHPSVWLLMNNHTIEVDKECGEKDMDKTHSHICLINALGIVQILHLSCLYQKANMGMDNTFLFYLISVSWVVKNCDRNVLVILAMMSTRKTRQQKTALMMIMTGICKSIYLRIQLVFMVVKTWPAGWGPS